MAPRSDDTIVAISTPAGRGGLGVVRLSGPDALRIAQKIVRRAGQRANEAAEGKPAAALALAPWRVTYAELPDEDNPDEVNDEVNKENNEEGRAGQSAVIDHVLATYFPKPRSYTAEDVVEVSCHGSPVVLEFLVRRCLDAGARLAEPGEFTLRAFLNGRIDLTQAEAVNDLIEARTLYQARVAAQQVEGAVSHRLAPVKKQLVDLISLLEAGIDFAEDDVSVLPAAEIGSRMEPVEQSLAQLAESFETGKLIQQGLTLAILGRPNVGKSSLFNCLLDQDRAIVTATPGTTRDLVSETVDLEGIPLRCVDTAGVRRAFEEAEAIGVRKSYEAAADSDLALLVLDGSEEMTAEDRDLLERLSALGKMLLVVNKCDLPQQLDRKALDSEHDTPVLLVSALKREGIDPLRQAILKTAAPALAGDRESQFLTNIRQERLVCESLDALAASRQSLENGVPHEMLLLDLYNALRPLDAITGETTIEDILNNIFATFCIGK